MSDTPTPEVAVRSYLTFLEDPSKLIDQAAVAKLQKAAEAAKDPIEKLKALAGLDAATATDGDAYRAAFIQHAKQWAGENGIPSTAFAQLGVGTDVLRSAGLLPKTAGRPTGASGSTKERSKSVSSTTIREHILRIEGEFTLAGLQESVGGSHMTLRKVVDELLKSGTIALLGRDPNWSSRGRAPFIYRVA